MKLKTKAKILSGIFTVSCMLGNICSNHTFAQSWSIDKMKEAYIQANALSNATDNKDYINRLIRIALNKQVSMQIGEPEKIATTQEICYALQVAYDYYLMMGRNCKFINAVENYILSNHIDVNSDNGRILHTAAALGRGCFRLLNTLLFRCGADINIVSELSGNTPLHTAIKFEQYSIARHLINCGARTDIPDKNGALPEIRRLYR